MATLRECRAERKGTGAMSRRTTVQTKKRDTFPHTPLIPVSYQGLSFYESLGQGRQTETQQPNKTNTRTQGTESSVPEGSTWQTDAQGYSYRRSQTVAPLW